MSRPIDADALKRRCRQQIQDPWNHSAAPTSWADAYRAFIDEIDAAPTINAVPVVRGKWIKCDVEKWRDGALKCSECGKGYHLPHEVMLFDWNFCPNCGADMRKEIGHEM